MRLAPLPLSNIASNFRDTHDIAVRIPDRRNSQRDIDLASVPAAANGLIMLDLFTAPDAFEKRWLIPRR